MNKKGNKKGKDKEKAANEGGEEEGEEGEWEGEEEEGGEGEEGEGEEGGAVSVKSDKLLYGNERQITLLKFIVLPQLYHISAIAKTQIMEHIWYVFNYTA